MQSGNCSFCDRTQTQVSRLIAGRGVFICDECVATCVAIVEEARSEKKARDDQPAQELTFTDLQDDQGSARTAENRQVGARDKFSGAEAESERSRVGTGGFWCLLGLHTSSWQSRDGGHTSYYAPTEFVCERCGHRAKSQLFGRLRCRLGRHEWDRCYCKRNGCYQRRPELHQWNRCRCTVCRSRNYEACAWDASGFCEHCKEPADRDDITSGWHFWAILPMVPGTAYGTCLERIDRSRIRAKVWSKAAPQGEIGPVAVEYLTLCRPDDFHRAVAELRSGL